ncbi:MAG TPA: hypothetical protein VGS41_00075 [Chthonomonadales bacterium]|nr:hypothetical protein [Chthonomonadales bacterium]
MFSVAAWRSIWCSATVSIDDVDTIATRLAASRSNLDKALFCLFFLWAVAMGRITHHVSNQTVVLAVLVGAAVRWTARRGLEQPLVMAARRAVHLGDEGSAALLVRALQAMDSRTQGRAAEALIRLLPQVPYSGAGSLGPGGRAVLFGALRRQRFRRGRSSFALEVVDFVARTGSREAIVSLKLALWLGCNEPLRSAAGSCLDHLNALSAAPWDREFLLRAGSNDGEAERSTLLRARPDGSDPAVILRPQDKSGSSEEATA